MRCGLMIALLSCLTVSWALPPSLSNPPAQEKRAETEPSSLSIRLAMPAKVFLYSADRLLLTQSFLRAGEYALEVTALPPGLYRLKVFMHGTTAQIAMAKTYQFSLPGVVKIDSINPE